MDVIEIIQEEIPEELFNRKIINLIEHLLKLDGILFPEETTTALDTEEAA